MFVSKQQTKAFLLSKFSSLDCSAASLLPASCRHAVGPQTAFAQSVTSHNGHLAVWTEQGHMLPSGRARPLRSQGKPRGHKDGIPFDGVAEQGQTTRCRQHQEKHCVMDGLIRSSHPGQHRPPGLSEEVKSASRQYRPYTFTWYA
ncbi:unnamed protein product [Protopolystoma xenopodis]|uniref:Uncharacterized protein n=1 Tax=Protopolystoma xenopodis TaxID=117903 RepID=A0A3S5BL88_9PLAT|nr:unnamed protein product [Protopolystoma xenopodis]